VLEDTAFMFEAMGVATGIDIERLGAVRELVAKALPGVTMYGAIAKAGLPRNFHPVARHPLPNPPRLAGEGMVGAAA
jgi:hydroxymethylglutaryl-CoA lyase